MKRMIAVIAVLAAGLGMAQAAGPAGRQTGAKIAPAPKVEVAFVLDTTGSMSGLIAGAKAKIWYIANQIVLGKPRPVVKMALIGYRDKTDDYVTKVFDLTDNIDQVYTDLMSFKAAGGGDRPEHVNKALQDAVEKLSWSTDSKTMKVIYLVGDSPPHNEYKDTPTFDKLAKAAIAKGIVVNTVLCGGHADTAGIWQQIAKLSDGAYLEIVQSGGVQTVATPYDAELAKLNRELVGTAVVYGKAAEQARQSKLNAMAKEMGRSDAAGEAGAAADRAVYSARTGSAANNDLVADVAKKKVQLEKVDKDELPENMQKMTPEEQKKYIADQQAKRDEVLKQIKAVSAKRDAYIKTEAAKAPAKKAGFDAKVVDSIKIQAKKYDIEYKE